MIDDIAIIIQLDKESCYQVIRDTIVKYNLEYITSSFGIEVYKNKSNGTIAIVDFDTYQLKVKGQN